MKHRWKEGRCVIDKDVKFLKKLLVKKNITFLGKFFRENDCEIKVTKIRKYKNSLLYHYLILQYQGFEIDLTVKFLDTRYRHPYWEKRNMNSKIRRYKNERKLSEELVFFNINDFQISKITYEN